jgi:thiol-disulfide isomerase/thioredoxin
MTLGAVLSGCQNTSTISGKLLGSDGNPMPLAHVYLVGATPDPALMSKLRDPIFTIQEVEANGSFSIRTSETGSLGLLCTGVGHYQSFIPLPIEDHTDIQVDIRLAKAFGDTSRSEIQILTSVDGGATTQSTFLQKQPDGSYRATVPAKADSIEYMAFGNRSTGGATTLIGASASRYRIAIRNEYVSVVPAIKGMALIEYRVPPHISDVQEKCVFVKAHATLPAFTRMQQDFADRDASAMIALQDHLSNGKEFRTFVFPWLEFADTLVTTALQTNDRLLKDELTLEALECYQKANAPIRDTRLRKMLIEVPPTSLSWPYHRALALSTQRIPQFDGAYFASIIQHHSSRTFVAYLLFNECIAAKQSRDNAKLTTLLTRLESEFRGTRGASAALESFSPSDSLKVGSLLPDFHFQSLDDSHNTFTNATFRGQPLLIVFWATWCTPCVGEMPILHRMHEKYPGLRILSLALSDSPKHIASFRKYRWPMPWSVAVVSTELEAPIRRQFPAFAGTHILVDSAGRVLTLGALDTTRIGLTLNE